MARYYEAENYLSLAKWAILKSEDCANDIKSKLHRNFGQLYAARGQYDKALHQLALDVLLY
ncbi:Zinc finger MYND domain-containing protein 12 [Boothiomyces macroporosus]|uniref:Zinc finger MYND domain-containing protein 12 n=1 Tax=Boothiomyces macroporosus TaxID=261099 RepID=A0AAD5UHD6_9FUNG|nr:Zinc finger MYND domain-containing protein 12 [Boothiomyces macroporosus]